MLDKGSCTASKLRSLLGTLESVRIVTEHAALHKRGLQYQLPCPGPQGTFPGKSWINFSKAAKSNLSWWTKRFTTAQHTSA